MKYQAITCNDLLNGSGIRVVLWVSGCTHHCEGCHNPETWNVNDGMPFGQAELNYIYNELSHDYISGITFSGGDPFHPKNRADVIYITSEIKKHFPNKNIWVYTGYLFEEVLEWNLDISNIDVIIDGEFIKELISPELPWIGSSNQRIIDVKESLINNKLIPYNYNITI